MFKNIVYQVVSMWLPSVALHIFPFISITLLTMALCSFKRKCVKARKGILNLGSLGAIFATELIKSSLSCGSIDFRVFEWCPWFVCLLDINFHEIVHFVVVSMGDLWTFNWCFTPQHQYILHADLYTYPSMQLRRIFNNQDIL